MRLRVFRAAFVVVAALSAAATAAAGEGDVVQSDNLGMNVVTWNLSQGTFDSVFDKPVLSEFVGLHRYFWQDVRLGMNIQVSEALYPPKKGDPLRTFALLPQIGWNCGGPFFVAGVFTFAPITNGTERLVLGVQAVGGASFEIVPRVKLSAAIEVPYNFFPDQTIGLTPLAGVSFRLD